MAKNDKYIPIHAGDILIAEPFMEDPNFHKAVVMICSSDRTEGVIGFIMNKPVGMQLEALISDFPDFEAQVYYGGPVQTDTIHYLHTRGELMDGCIEVSDGIYWGGDFEQLKYNIKVGEILSEEIRFFVGYAGWESDQLQTEIKEHVSWIVSEGSEEYVLGDLQKEAMWSVALQRKGGIYHIISQMSNPFLN